MAPLTRGPPRGRQRGARGSASARPSAESCVSLRCIGLAAGVGSSVAGVATSQLRIWPQFPLSPEPPSAAVSVRKTRALATELPFAALSPRESSVTRALVGAEVHANGTEPAWRLPDGRAWVAQYARWHAQMLEGIRRRGDPETGDARFVVLCALGGMGNEVVSILSAVLFAVLTERVFLLGCRTGGSDWVLGGFEAPFQWYGGGVLSPEALTKPEGRDNTKELTSTHWDKDYSSQTVFRCTDFRELSQRTVYILSNQLFAGAILQNPLFGDLISAAFVGEHILSTFFRALFKVKRDVIDLVERFKRDHFPKYTIGLQWRSRTFDGAWIQQIKGCIGDASGALGVPEGEDFAVYLAAYRGREAADEILKTYPHMRFILFEDHAAAYGFNLGPANCKEDRVFGNDDCDKAALVDALLASMADDVVTTAFSTFGYLVNLLARRAPLEMTGEDACRFETPQKLDDMHPACTRQATYLPCFHQARCYSYPQPFDQACPGSVALASEELWKPVFRQCSNALLPDLRAATRPPFNCASEDALLEHNDCPMCNRSTTCHCPGGAVKYGYGKQWSSWRQVLQSVPCNNDHFDDPFEGQSKMCVCSPGGLPAADQ